MSEPTPASKPLVDVHGFDAGNAFNAYKQDIHLHASVRQPGSRISLPDPLPRFTGRTQDLKDLHASLQTEGNAALCQTSLSSQGGVGKTVLAIEYAWLSKDYYPGGRYYITTESGSPDAELARLSQAVGVEAGPSVPETAAAVRAAIEGHGENSLMIIDNVGDAETWRRWARELPGPPCRRVVTTRELRLPDLHPLPIGRLSEDECLDLLERFREDAKTPESIDATRSIVDWLDGWSVVVALVGAYMSIEPDLSWAAYWQRLDDRGLDSLRTIRKSAHLHAGDYDDHVDALLSDMLEKLDVAERRLVEYAALLPEDKAPESWLRALVQREIDTGILIPKTHEGFDEPFTRAFGRLRRFDLLLQRQDESDGRLLSLHRVIRRRVAENLCDGR